MNLRNLTVEALKEILTIRQNELGRLREIGVELGQIEFHMVSLTRALTADTRDLDYKVSCLEGGLNIHESFRCAIKKHSELIFRLNEGIVIIKECIAEMEAKSDK